MKTFKKVFNVIMCVVMILTAAPLSGFVGLDLSGLFEIEAEALTYEGYCGKNLTWTLDVATGELVITGTGSMYDGYNVAWYEYRDIIRFVTVEYGVESIGNYAFSECSGLKTVTIADSVKKIGEYAFISCSSLTSIVLPSRVSTISRSAFAGCRSLTSVEIDSVYWIEEYAFANSGLTSLTIPAKTWSIAHNAFYGCSELSSINVDENNGSYSSDSYGVLFNKDKTKLIQYPIGNTKSSYTVPDGVTTIAESAFENGNSLTSVTIPNGVTTIGETAFKNCNSLTSVTIPNSVTTLGEYAFSGCESLANITVDINNSVYSSDSYGVLFNKDKTTLIQYPDDNAQTNYTIPDSVITIGNSAFSGSDITSVVIPDSVTFLGKYVFGNCSNLTSVIIGNGISAIPYEGFRGCKNLKSVTIAASVTSIDSYAFYDCPIKNVYYTGTEKQWKNIRIITNTPLTRATIHYNYDPSAGTHYTASVITDSTCTSTGVMAYTCLCGYSYTETIAKKDHISGDWITTEEASCSKTGTKVKKCTVCSRTVQTESIPKKSHTPGEWKTALAPTTEDEGKKIKKCTVCGETVEEIITPKINESVVLTPSQSTINYGDSIVLHIDAEFISEGGYVEWEASNNNFTFSVSEDGTTCTISPSVSGDTTFTATVYDEDGRPISVDEQTMTSKAGFWQKFISFFKNLFGISRIILQSK